MLFPSGAGSLRRSSPERGPSSRAEEHATDSCNVSIGMTTVARARKEEPQYTLNTSKNQQFMPLESEREVCGPCLFADFSFREANVGIHSKHATCWLSMSPDGFCSPQAIQNAIETGNTAGEKMARHLTCSSFFDLCCSDRGRLS